jgi:hypothetical protein
MRNEIDDADLEFTHAVFSVDGSIGLQRAAETGRPVEFYVNDVSILSNQHPLATVQGAARRTQSNAHPPATLPPFKALYAGNGGSAT